MKLKGNFLVHVTETENMLIPAGGAGFTGMIRGNRTFGEILRLLQTDTSEEKMVSDLMTVYNGPKESIQKDVKKAVETLRKVGALDES